MRLAGSVRTVRRCRTECCDFSRHFQPSRVQRPIQTSVQSRNIRHHLHFLSRAGNHNRVAPYQFITNLRALQHVHNSMFPHSHEGTKNTSINVIAISEAMESSFSWLQTSPWSCDVPSITTCALVAQEYLPHSVPCLNSKLRRVFREGVHVSKPRWRFEFTHGSVFKTNTAHTSHLRTPPSPSALFPSTHTHCG